MSPPFPRESAIPRRRGRSPSSGCGLWRTLPPSGTPRPAVPGRRRRRRSGHGSPVPSACGASRRSVAPYRAGHRALSPRGAPPPRTSGTPTGRPGCRRNRRRPAIASTGSPSPRRIRRLRSAPRTWNGTPSARARPCTAPTSPASGPPPPGRPRRPRPFRRTPGLPRFRRRHRRGRAASRPPRRRMSSRPPPAPRAPPGGTAPRPPG